MNDSPAQSNEHSERDHTSSAFFPDAQHFAISGGNFTIKNIHRTPPERAPEFRSIPIGDLNLQHELDVSLVRRATRDPGSVRRVYSVRIHGYSSSMTAAVYQGKNAEERWRQDVARYSWLRHPNFLQLFGAATSADMYAAVFHDDFIPVRQVLEKYSDSPVSTVYLWGYFEQEFGDAWRYLYAVSGTELEPFGCTMGLRPSTGHLCIDLTPTNSNIYIFYSPRSTSFRDIRYRPQLQDSKIISSISLDHYHKICFLYLSRFRYLSVFGNTSIQLGSIISFADGSELVNVTNNLDPQDSGWLPELSERDDALFVAPSGWTRLTSDEVQQIEEIFRKIYYSGSQFAVWLAQANHIFTHLKVRTGHENYVFVHGVEYRLEISRLVDIPPGYLFLCPLKDLQTNASTRLYLPQCPAYWSLDPSGAQRLTPEEAHNLGFPTAAVIMEAQGMYLERSVYGGLGQLYRGKGYDPDTQDLARELEYPLYHLSGTSKITKGNCKSADLC
ncbi:hypothetical protein B0H16DRAFT_1558859 [Mycena metata]|uniref:Uncharacterized protein n=1 Tax=Mycena metata TaxID=1033252 RepID=A0AAD7IMY3_9AGAR|nr:hypothetical protein B0H16DRAFT_1558859 [Mycena metata]